MGGYDLALRVNQFDLEVAFALLTGQLDVQLYGSVLVLAVQICAEEEVPDLCFGSRPQEYVSEDATETPEILTFQVTAISETVYFNGQYVAAFFVDVGCQVKFGRQVAVFRVAYFLAVQPVLDTGFLTVLTDNFFGSFP